VLVATHCDSNKVVTISQVNWCFPLSVIIGDFSKVTVKFGLGNRVENHECVRSELVGAGLDS
jgi:hypothetical protein